jgi:two-component system, NtrC family, sensor kinase
MSQQLTDRPSKASSDFTSPMMLSMNSVSLGKAEESFEEGKNFSEGLINCLPGIFFLLDDNLQFLHWNKNLEEITGYPTEELAVMNLLDLFAGEEKNIVSGKFSDVFDLGASSVEAQILTKNGARIPYALRTARSFINDKPHLIAIGIDLVERYQNEELLRNLSRAVEQSASSIAITATDGTIEYVNPKFCQINDYGLEEVIGQNPLKRESNAQLPDIIFGDAWDTVSSGGEWHGERQIRPKSGGSIWVSVSISPIRNADNEVSHYLAVKEDITERKKTERELHKSKAELLVQHEQLKSLLWKMERAKKEWENTMDCIGDIVILTDTEDGIRRCNKSLLELTGATYSEVSGNKWQELLSGHGLALPSPCTPGSELCHEPSGKWFIFNSYPFTDSTCNAVSGAVITLHDNTVLKHFTGELENAYSDLKATQAKVVQQEKMASIGQLAAGVAHEINNPMGFISSNLGTLGKYIERLNDFILALSEGIETLPPNNAVAALRDKRKALKVDYILEDGKELIKESLDGAERVRTIVKNLKSFSRVDEAECKDADINECITSTINIVWNELKYKVKLVKDLGEIPLLKCHPQQLNQVFMNLLVNAGQAIENQGEITVRTWHENGSIYASISDNGCGMTPEVINRIFEPFYTTKEVGKGTGLGLSITYDIIKKHNGEITVESEPGNGTTFMVRLPTIEKK